MNYNPTPRVEFHKSAESIKRHHELVEDETLRSHLRIALQEMQVRASMNTDAANFNQCAAAHLRMLGAQDFLDIFLNLAENMDAAVARKDTINLPQNRPSVPARGN